VSADRAAAPLFSIMLTVFLYRSLLETITAMKPAGAIVKMV
jgi:hypothetical protein